MAKIIILEDDPMISEIYYKKFEEAGFDVFAADSGKTALELARKEKVDLILLDLIMSKMDGFQVIENLRAGGYDKNIKIVVFSNLSQKEDYDRAMKLGADEFIIKSDHTPSSLIKEIRRILNQNSEEKRNEEIKKEQKENHEPGQKKRILFVEDEKIFIEMFGDKLRQDGFEVETAENGVWGLKEALAKPFDLFIIDMVMPAMTGEEIIQKLKMEEKTKNIPIIVLSASVESQAEKKVRDLGANEFFIKTQIIPSELSNKVGELLSKS